jgi:hypothetical protein
MAVFSINQVRQLYVAKELKTGSDLLATDKVGAILPKTDTDKTTLYLQYMSPAGIVSSDKINIANVMYAKATDASAMAHKLARYELTLDADVSAAPVAGQEYILRLAFRHYIGLGENDQQFKYGFVKVQGTMTASDFYKKMALSLFDNVKRDVTPLVNIYVVETSTETPITDKTKEANLTGTYTKIVIEEVEQDWILGRMPQAFMPFAVQPTTIIVDGDERIWGKVDKATPTKSVPNGHNIADLEYFCHGFRGDEYRGMGYPNNLITEYLVDPTLKYNTIDIHYAYVGSNESVQKSEKDITIVVPKVGENNATANELTNKIIAAINKASGLSIAALPTDKE